MGVPIKPTVAKDFNIFRDEYEREKVAKSAREKVRSQPKPTLMRDFSTFQNQYEVSKAAKNARGKSWKNANEKASIHGGYPHAGTGDYESKTTSSKDQKRARSTKPEDIMYTLDLMIFEYSCRFQMFRRRFNMQMYYQRRWRRRICFILNWISEYLGYFKLFQGVK